MENEYIHDKLDMSELRTFIAKQIQMASNVGIYHSDIYYEKMRQDLITEIEYAQEKLKLMDIIKAFHDIMKSKNWEEHDISDYIKYNPKTYFSFIGTKNELTQFMESIGYKIEWVKDSYENGREYFTVIKKGE